MSFLVLKVLEFVAWLKMPRTWGKKGHTVDISV